MDECAMFQAIRRNRVSRWAAIFIAVNAWVLLTSALKYWHPDRLLTIWPDAAHVHPYLDPETREIVHYIVSDVSVSEIARQAQWPDCGELFGLATVNIAMLAWLFRLSFTQKPPALPNTETNAAP